jgi:predicted phosphodiesterase
MSLTIIGDVHGRIKEYERIVKNSKNPTLQIGDFGFAPEYKWLNEQSGIDPLTNKVLRGNHDDYTVDSPHLIGDFGLTDLGGTPFFFIRGAFSIDKRDRTPHVDWWPEEELTPEEMDECFTFYKYVKPSIVISHDCPMSVNRLMYSLIYPSRTIQFLDDCFNAHKPNLWIFGHHHVTRKILVSKTVFQCIGELDTYELI